MERVAFYLNVLKDNRNPPDKSKNHGKDRYDDVVYCGDQAPRMLGVPNPEARIAGSIQYWPPDFRHVER